MDAVVDVDAAVTWPGDVRRRAEEIANHVRGRSRHTSDLEVSPGVGDAFRGHFVGRLLRAYHATRFLSHEIDVIRSQGLRVLEEGLILERIERAYALDHLTVAERDQLIAGNVFAEKKARGRAGHVSLFISKTLLNRGVSGLRPLLTTWGGEGIYMARGGYALRERLGQIGTPTIVVVQVDLGPDPAVHVISPDLWKLFVGRLLGREPRGADLLYKATVPPGGVVEFWQRGDAAYDEHRRLPRT